MIDLSTQIKEFRTNPNYKHSFIIGTPGHWISLSAINRNFIVEDSANNSQRINDKNVLGLINILRNFAILSPDSIKYIKMFSNVTQAYKI